MTHESDEGRGENVGSSQVGLARLGSVSGAWTGFQRFVSGVSIASGGGWGEGGLLG